LDKVIIQLPRIIKYKNNTKATNQTCKIIPICSYLSKIQDMALQLGVE